MPRSARDRPIEIPVRSTDSMIGMATASKNHLKAIERDNDVA